ncbi:uncharacterized protein TNCV_1817931 [Trichonephila clavipes]|nr:uncharacterized protein TNCV_1817931 [Trichonephila clavipes]
MSFSFFLTKNQSLFSHYFDCDFREITVTLHSTQLHCIVSVVRWVGGVDSEARTNGMKAKFRFVSYWTKAVLLLLSMNEGKGIGDQSEESRTTGNGGSHNSSPEVGGREKERLRLPDHPQSVLPLNWGGTEPNRTVNWMVLKAMVNDRRHLALCYDEFREPRSSL